MKSLKQLVKEAYEELSEAGLIIDKSSGKSYPKSDQILIMAGGAGSGKSFILDNLLLFDGKVLNPDITLLSVIRYGSKHPESPLAKKFLEMTGKELKNIDLKNSNDTSLIHDFIHDTEIHKKAEYMFFKAASTAKVKPNVVFDVQMRNLKQVQKIIDLSKLGGYKPENVSIVWVLNVFEMALKQNEMRERRIDPNMLEDFHIGVAETFSEVISHTDEWKKVINGDIWIVFNKKGVDIQTIPVARQDKKDPRKIKVKMSLDYSKESPYFAVHMKEKGKPARKWEDIGEAILKKILEYVPKSVRGIG